MKQTMKKIIAILLLAISASCSKSPVQVVPDDFTGNWYGHSFLKTINGDKQALIVDSPVRFEIRKDGTYTGTIYKTTSLGGIQIPYDSTVTEGRVRTVKDSISFSSHYKDEVFHVIIQIGFYHEFNSTNRFMTLKKENFTY